jgi:predicted NUDIX family phosphoesterase
LSETVLVVPTTALAELLPGRGFVPDAAGWRAMESASFLARAAAEDDEAHRQVIPYVVLRAADALFTYARNRRGNEARLHDLRSVGVGGHVNPADLPGGLAALAADPCEALGRAARRELAEEVGGVPGDAPLEWRGFIFDDDDGVSRVHVGVVYELAAQPEQVRLSDEGKMADGRFVQISDLASGSSRYEGWSRLTIEHLAARR